MTQKVEQKLDIANWIPDFGSIPEKYQNDLETSAQWIDFQIASASQAIPVLWPRPLGNQAANARNFVNSLCVGLVNSPLDAESRIKKIQGRANSAIEEITMICSTLEVMYPNRIREWEILGTRIRPSKASGYAHVMERAKAMYPTHESDALANVADFLIQSYRQRLVWAIGLTLSARDLIQHGRAMPISIEPSGVWSKVSIIRGMDYLPQAPNILIKPFDNLLEHKRFNDLAARVGKALRGAGSKLSDEEVATRMADTLQDINGMSEAVATARFALLMLLIEGTPGHGALTRRRILEMMGWPRGLPWEDERE